MYDENVEEGKLTVTACRGKKLDAHSMCLTTTVCQKYNPAVQQVRPSLGVWVQSNVLSHRVQQGDLQRRILHRFSGHRP